MKVVIITSSFPRYAGDYAGSFVHNLAQGLRGLGVEMFVLAPHTDSARLTESIEGVPVRRYVYSLPFRTEKLAYGHSMVSNMQRNPLLAIELPFFMMAAFLTVVGFVRRARPDVMNSHWLIPSGLVGVLCGKICGIPNLVTLHSSEVTLLKKLPGGRRLARMLLRQADSIVSVSRHRVEELLNILPPGEKDSIRKNISVVPMASRCDYSLNPKDNQKAKSDLDIDWEFTILFVGRLAEVKGCEYLLRSLKTVLDRNPRSGLVVVGTGALEGDLKKLVTALGLSEHVRFEGSVNHGRIWQYYAAADVVVIPSITDSAGYEEGMPVVLLEALSSGKPVIATRTKGIMEVIEDGQNGVLVDPRDSAQIGRAIIRMMDQTQTKDEYARNAMATGARFNCQDIATAYVDKFELLASHKSEKGEQ